MELWKINNLFKIFLLSFILAYLTSLFLIHSALISQSLVLVLIAGVGVYISLGTISFLRKQDEPLWTIIKRTRVRAKTLIGVSAIVILFVGAFLLVRYETTPQPGYQLVSSQFLVLPDGTPLVLHPFVPSNECAWIESMNATTQQRARSQGVSDCDYAWPHANLSKPTLFLEFANFTEFVYSIENGTGLAPSVARTSVLCFTIPSASYQCWIPPATVSHLR